MVERRNLLDSLHAEAVSRNLIAPENQIDAATAFHLVRDMPYLRASSRDPGVTIREWRGTCSGKHYLLKALLEELGLQSQVIACTTEYILNPEDFPDEIQNVLRRAGGRIVDVHNYLILKLPDAEMVVDVTWPMSTRALGFTVNEKFELGTDQQIACLPIQKWVVPEDSHPQLFKEELLRANFTPEELTLRDEFIRLVGKALYIGI